MPGLTAGAGSMGISSDRFLQSLLGSSLPAMYPVGIPPQQNMQNPQYTTSLGSPMTSFELPVDPVTTTQRVPITYGTSSTSSGSSPRDIVEPGLGLLPQEQPVSLPSDVVSIPFDDSRTSTMWETFLRELDVPQF
jgi:hypothetical protein